MFQVDLYPFDNDKKKDWPVLKSTSLTRLPAASWLGNAKIKNGSVDYCGVVRKGSSPSIVSVWSFSQGSGLQRFDGIEKPALTLRFTTTLLVEKNMLVQLFVSIGKFNAKYRMTGLDSRAWQARDALVEEISYDVVQSNGDGTLIVFTLCLSSISTGVPCDLYLYANYANTLSGSGKIDPEFGNPSSWHKFGFTLSTTILLLSQTVADGSWSSLTSDSCEILSMESLSEKENSG